MLLHVHVNNILFLKTGATTPFIEMPLPLSQNMCIPKHVPCVGPLQETSSYSQRLFSIELLLPAGSAGMIADNIPVIVTTLVYTNHIC